MTVATGALATAANLNAAFASLSADQTISGEKIFDALGLTQENNSQSSTVNQLTYTKNCIRVGSATAINGVEAPTGGLTLFLLNTSGADITIGNESGSATAADRIITGTGGDFTFKDTAAIILIYDLTSTRWRMIGGGGSGGTAMINENLLTNYGAEDDATGWTGYDDAGSYVDGTGGTSSNTAMTQTTTAAEILAGTASFEFAKSAADASGEGQSTDTITLPNKLKGKVTKLKFNYSVSANFTESPLFSTTASSATVRCYDVTNGAELTLTVNNLDGSGLYVGYVLLPSDCDDVRISINVDESGTDAWDLFIDDMFFGQDSIFVGSAESVYSASIANNGTATVTTESSPFVDSVSRTGAGLVTINLVSGFFSVAPSVAIGADASTGNRIAVVKTVSTSAITIETRILSTDSLSDNDFFIVLQRQGDDYAGTNNLNVQLVEGVAENTFSAFIDGLSGASADVQTSNIDFIESVTQTSTGDFDIVWKSGFFSAAPSVTGVVYNSNGSNLNIADVTSSGCSVHMESNAGTDISRNFSLMVQRQGSDYRSPTSHALVYKDNKVLIAETDAGQTISHSTYTPIVFEDEIQNDFGSWWDGTTFTPTRDIIVRASMTFRWASNIGANEAFLATFRSNGSTNIRVGIMEHSNASDDSGMVFTAIIKIDAGEAITFCAWQGTGGNESLSSSALYNNLSVEEIK